MLFIDPLVRTIRTANLSRVAKDLRHDLPAFGHDAADAVEQVLEAVAKAADDIAKGVERTADHARDDIDGASRDAAHTTRDLAASAGSAFDSVSSAASVAAARVGGAAARAGRDLHLDGRIDDVVQRIRTDLPSDRLTSLVETLERSLPSTDRDRYDRAYLRGWTRARTAFVGVGLATGVAAGIAGAFLLDPERGERRRSALQARARDLGRTVRERAAAAGDKAREMARERGMATPRDEHLIASIEDAITTHVPPFTPPPLVPVMDAFPGTLAADITDPPASDEHVIDPMTADVGTDGELFPQSERIHEGAADR